MKDGFHNISAAGVNSLCYVLTNTRCVSPSVLVNIDCQFPEIVPEADEDPQ
jgi:hypothetical protein